MLPIVDPMIHSICCTTHVRQTDRFCGVHQLLPRPKERISPCQNAAMFASLRRSDPDSPTCRSDCGLMSLCSSVCHFHSDSAGQRHPHDGSVKESTRRIDIWPEQSRECLGQTNSHPEMTADAVRLGNGARGDSPMATGVTCSQNNPSQCKLGKKLSGSWNGCLWRHKK